MSANRITDEEARGLAIESALSHAYAEGDFSPHDAAEFLGRFENEIWSQMSYAPEEEGRRALLYVEKQNGERSIVQAAWSGLEWVGTCAIMPVGCRFLAWRPDIAAPDWAQL